MGVVSIYYLGKIWASSLKNEWAMLNSMIFGLVRYDFVWFCMVLSVVIVSIYCHAKFWASSLKNDWVMLNLVTFGLVWYGFVWYGFWVLSRRTTMPNFELLAWKMAELCSVKWCLVWYGLVWFGLIWFCMVRSLAIIYTYYHAKFWASSLKNGWVILS